MLLILEKTLDRGPRVDPGGGGDEHFFTQVFRGLKKTKKQNKKNSSWHLKGWMEIALGQQYNVGEKPAVILYTYINRHAGTPKKH